MNVSVKIYFSLDDVTVSDQIQWLAEQFDEMRLDKIAEKRDFIEAEVTVPFELYKKFSRQLTQMQIPHLSSIKKKRRPCCE